jgi:hypothetical protein
MLQYWIQYPIIRKTQAAGVGAGLAALEVLAHEADRRVGAKARQRRKAD